MITGKEKLYVSEGAGVASVSVEEIAEFAQQEGGAVTWDSIQGKPATFAPTIGTTADTAKAGDYAPSVSDLGVSQTVQNFLNAADMNGCQSQIGGTSTGKLLFTAASPADACGAITAISWGTAPTNTQRGGVFQQAAIADISAAPTQANFNGLLAALRASGILASS